MTAEPRLVIAYNFPPFSDASAVTAAKRIVDAGEDVHVVMQDLTKVRPRDETLWQLVAPFVQERHILRGPVQFLTWLSLESFIDQGLARLIAKGPLSRYDRMYSRTMWPHSHLLAGAIRVRSPKTTWQAEFSDPLLWHVDGKTRHSPTLPHNKMTRSLVRALPARYQRLLGDRPETLQLVQFLPFALADEIIFTNDQQRELMLGDLPDGRMADAVFEKSVVSAHPTPPSSWTNLADGPGPEDNGRVHFGYFGSLYPNRGLGALLEAIRILPPSDQDRLSVDLFTPNVTQSEGVIKRMKLGDIVHAKRALPYTRFMSVAAKYDYLLVFDTQGGDFPVANPFLPSKISDYLGTGAEVMVVVAPGSELEKRAYEYEARVGDVGSIARCLGRAIRSRSSEVPRPVTSGQAISSSR
jgi:glycosyltransferase involved in cell wall biosynthesis